MVKADLTRDYYGDLDLQPGADAQEIKKQFKKLALTYHPDRNPGRETEVTAKFQKIQSAHEVLTDAQERAKYDANRIRSNYKPSYSGGTSSGVRGNPWSNAGSQWAPPPKPPTARNRAPPPSTGAGRYAKFGESAPKTSQSTWEGPEARTKNYEAWENMRSHTKPTKTAPKPPPREVPTPKKDYRRPAPTRSAFDEYQEAFRPRPEDFADATPASPHRRTASTNASARKGFMPNTPGGDEPAAPGGAYFTARAPPPPVPPRNAPPAQNNVGADPLKQFREEEDGAKVPNLEKRYTPYATHGGEKLNPFESTNINRSKSTRETPNKPGSKQVPRTGSDPNLSSPRQQRTRAHRGVTIEIDSDSDSSDDALEMNGGVFGKSRASMRRSNGSTAPPRGQPAPAAAEASSTFRKPISKLGRFQEWMRENPDKEPPVNSWPPDGPSLRSEQNPTDQPDKDKMYGSDQFYSPINARNFNRSSTFPTVSETNSSKDPKTATGQDMYGLDRYATLLRNSQSEDHAVLPSGVRRSSHLNAFEGLQRNLVDQLLSNKKNGSSSKPADEKYRTTTSQNGKHPINGDPDSPSKAWRDYREPADSGSPSKKSKPLKHLHSELNSQRSNRKSSVFIDLTGDMNGESTNANRQPYRFNFPVNDDTFKPTKPVPNGFTSNSAENISTTFAAEDWDGKFAAGADFFQPERKTTSQSRGRAQSTSRSRVRSKSPSKTSTAPKFAQPTQPNAPTESPGGTKFASEEWAHYFKSGTPGLFQPTPSVTPRSRRSRASVARPTMGGKAAVVDDSETSDEKPLFDSKPADSSEPVTTASPEPMDVDTPPTRTATPPPPPPAATQTVPKITESPIKESLKRPAEQPAETASLKVNFDDLKIVDLLSSLKLPPPPSAPAAPHIPTQYERPNPAALSAYKSQFAAYMADWDLFNNKYLLHLVARKNQVDSLGARRWEDENGVEFYRRGLREDDAVLSHWQEARAVHEKAMKEYVVIGERMKTREEMAPPISRKKTH